MDANGEAALLAPLYPFQRQGVRYLLEKRRAILADEMGLGKTVQALVWAAILRRRAPAPVRVLVVCPAVMKLTWAREITRWLGEAPAVARTGRDLPTSADTTYVVNYDLLPRLLPHLRYWGPAVIIFDEAHYLKNPRAQRTRAARMLAADVPHVALLTGTPVLNRPIELAEPLRILGRLGQFGGWLRFATHYCGARRGPFGWEYGPVSAQRLAELHTALSRCCYLRRTKAEVLADLPPKQISVVPLPITNRAAYRLAAQDVVQYLRLVRGDDAAWRASRAERLVRLGVLKQLAAEGKLAAALEWIGDFLEETDQKLVVFAVHHAVLAALVDGLRERGVEVAVVRGGDPADTRQAEVDRFQTRGACRVLVASLLAAGVGLTLTAASHVAFLEYGWRPADHRQAEDRCHRIGQSRPVTVYHLVADGTVDALLQAVLARKAAVVDLVTDGRLPVAVDEDIVVDEVVDALLAEEAA